MGWKNGIGPGVFHKLGIFCLSQVLRETPGRKTLGLELLEFLELMEFLENHFQSQAGKWDWAWIIP